MKPADVLKKADNIVRFLLKTVTLCMFAVLMIMIALNVFNRLVPITSFHWLDEIIELCFAAMTFYGAAAVWIIVSEIGSKTGLPILREKRFCVY